MNTPLSQPIPLLSILLVNYNGFVHLDECLSSIYAQGFEDFEVVMVDNASGDDSVSFVKSRFPRVNVVISDSNRGFAGGNNLGLLHCRGEYVFFLNNDTRLHPRALENIAQAIHTHTRTHVFACFLIDFHNPERVDSAGDTIYTAGIPFSFTGFPVSKFTSERPVTSACAGAAVYQRELLKKMEGFDEDFFLIYEDLDLSLRARHAGEEILFIPSVKVYHKGSASMGGKQSRTSFYYAERNLLWVMLKNYPLSALVKMLPRFMLLKLWRFMHAVRQGRVEAYFSASVASLRQIPLMLGKRREILKNSALNNSKFWRLLRPRWLRERIAISRGRFDLPL